MNISGPGIIIQPLSLILALAFFLVSACSGKSGTPPSELKRKPVSGVTVAAVEKSDVMEYAETSATVRAKTHSVISGRIMGSVTGVSVREGDAVKAGQILITIDDRDIGYRVSAAEKAAESASLNRALQEITLARYRNLFEQKAISRHEYDQIETQKKVADSEHERALASLAEAKTMLGFTRITAPFSGTVVEKKTEPGSMSIPGMPLLALEDGSSYTANADVGESSGGQIKKGDIVPVFIEALNARLSGKITSVVPAADPATKTFPVKAEISAPGLKSGLSAKILIPSGRKTILAVPEKAVVTRGQLTGLYVVDDKGVVAYRLVRTGKKYPSGIEIVSGVKPGERIIFSGVENAVDGGIVSVPR